MCSSYHKEQSKNKLATEIILKYNNSTALKNVYTRFYILNVMTAWYTRPFFIQGHCHVIAKEQTQRKRKKFIN